MEVAGDAGQGGQEEVAEGMADEPAAVGKAVLEQAGQQVLVVRQGDDAVADVARRQDPELPPQAAGRAAVVGDGDHAGEASEARRPDLVLQAAQQRRQAGAAADRHQGAAAAGACQACHGGHGRFQGHVCQRLPATSKRETGVSFSPSAA